MLPRERYKRPYPPPPAMNHFCSHTKMALALNKVIKYIDRHYKEHSGSQDLESVMHSFIDIAVSSTATYSAVHMPFV